MKEKIEEVLTKFGIHDKVIIGCGARDSGSEIHYRIPSNAQPVGKHYAIQFEQGSQMIALWDLEKRVEVSASLDLYVKKDLTWESITNTTICEVAIGRRNSGRITKVVIMPLQQLELFLSLGEEFGFAINDNRSDYENDYLSSDVETNSEGQVVYYYGKRYERNPAFREAAIEIQGYKCKVCGFDFEEFYGDIGHGYIEVHHIKPLSEGEQNPDPATDLVVVCSNCHKMIHRDKKKTLSPEDLKKRIKVKFMTWNNYWQQQLSEKMIEKTS